MVPVSEDELKGDTTIAKFNLATHLCWILTLWMASHSVLCFYQRFFADESGEIPKWAKKTLPLLHLLIVLWGLGSVSFIK